MDFSALNPRSSNSLNLAARNNDVKTLRGLLKNGRNPNCNDNRGWTAIHEAAASDSFDALKILLKHSKTLPLSQTFEGHTCLYLACRNGCSSRTINLIIENVKDIVMRCTTEKVSPLHVICTQGRAEIVQILIDADANMNHQDLDDDTPLHEAARNKHAEVMSILLHAGAEPEQKNLYGLTPFLLSCFKGSLECVRTVLPFVSDINECANDGNTGLILASRAGALDVVRFLLENDANPNIANNELALPLYISLTEGHSKVFKLLLPITDISEISKNIIHYACKPLYFSMDIIITLLESNLGPEFFNECEQFHMMLEKVLGFRPSYSLSPPLCSILNVIEYIYKSSKDLCETLLLIFFMKGVAVNPLYEEECPPLVYLHYCDHAECHPHVIEILIQQGCDVDYSTMPKNSALQIPDAIIASITSNGHTLPILFTYSIKVEPEQILTKLIEYNMIGNRISIEVLKRILPMCFLDVTACNSLQQQLTPFMEELNLEQIAELLELIKPHVPSLKHLCRRVIRNGIKRKNSTTAKFICTLEKLPLPSSIKLYLRFL